MRMVVRQRELSLVIVMVALGAFVYSQAPQFLSASNLSQVAIVAAIIAIAATGQALVVLTRNVDLSVDAMIGVVAFSVADMLRTHTLSVPLALAYGVALGLALGIINGVVVSVFRVPAIVATLGTMSVYRGFTFFLAGGRQVSLSDLPPEYISLARATVFGLPLYVVIAAVIIAISPASRACCGAPVSARSTPPRRTEWYCRLSPRSWWVVLISSVVRARCTAPRLARFFLV